MHNLKTYFNSLSRNVRWTVILIGLVVLWMLTGLFNPAPSKQAVEQKLELKTVTAQALKAQDMVKRLTLIGRSEADELVHLSAQVSGGQIVTTPAKNGDHVKKGDVLVQIDVGTRQKSVDAAKASAKAADVLVKAARRLSTEGFQAATTLAQREADLAAAQRTLAETEFLLNHTDIKAPTNGIVENVLVKTGDYVSAGDPIVKFLNTAHFLVVGYASQQERGDIVVGQPATATLVNGTEVDGIIRSIAHTADETTRTYRVDLLVDGEKYPDFPTGMSAELVISTKTVKAFFIPHSALVMSDKGDVGVMLADEGLTAKFYKIDMLDDTLDGVWVSNLPDEIILVVRGQAGLVDGEKIKTKLIESNG